MIAVGDRWAPISDKRAAVRGVNRPGKRGQPLGLVGGVGRVGAGRFIDWMKRPALGGGLRCNFRTYADKGVWCVCETTDLGTGRSTPRVGLEPTTNRLTAG